jgi:Na+/proline symporter
MQIMDETGRNVVILVCLIAYLAMCLGVGWWAMLRTRSSKDFFMAGRALGPIVVACAVFSSTMSGFGFVGGPGLNYAMGLGSMWMPVSAVFGFVIAFYLVSKRIRLIASLHDCISVPDVVAARYGSQTARFLTAVAILLGVMGFMAAQNLAMARVLETILDNIGWFGDVHFITCLVISFAVLVFYSVTGGIIASVYTDVMQGIVMVVAGVLILLAAYAVVEGGFTGASQTLLMDDPESIGPFGTYGMVGCLSWYFVFGVGLAGLPHVISKMMMTRTLEANRLIFPMSVLGYSLGALLWLSVGLVMRALVLQGGHPPLAAADQAAAEFLQFFAHPVLAGIVFAALFAAIMSTADSFLNVGTAAIIHDIPMAIRGRPIADELLWARVTTLGLAVVAASFALFSHYWNARLIALLGAFGYVAFAAALVPVIAIGLNWKRASPAAASAAIITSLCLNFYLEVADVKLPWGIYAGFAAFITSLIVFFTVSLLQEPRELPHDINTVMEI